MESEFDWKLLISSCLKHKKITKYESHLIEFFSRAFANTQIPNKSWFGTTKTQNSISLLTGRIYLAAYVFSGTDEGIWLLLDDVQLAIRGVEYKPVKSTLNSSIKLIWLHAAIDAIALVNQSPSVWNSFREATIKVGYTSCGKSVPSSNSISKKIRLDAFWENTAMYDELTVNNQILEEKISFCSRLTHEERLERIKNLSPIPEKSVVKTTVFKRNPYVAAEVLCRANGICENCKNPAPFYKVDKTPYLEVHHKVPLAEGGEDSIENSVALCPNCHRHVHYGSDTFVPKW